MASKKGKSLSSSRKKKYGVTTCLEYIKRKGKKQTEERIIRLADKKEGKKEGGYCENFCICFNN